MATAKPRRSSDKTADVAAFCRAVWRHELGSVAALAPRVDPNARDRFGYTPLLVAAQFGDLALVSLLVKRGAELNQGKVELTPLTLAARRKATDIVDFLRRQGAVPSLVTRVYLGDHESVRRELAQNGEKARLRDEAETPLLHHAALALDKVLVGLLLDCGAPVSDASPDGETALHRVADLRQAEPAAQVEVARLLLEHGADPNARNWADVTPLHQAVRARNLAVSALLLTRGADPNARDQRGSTPLRRAVSATGASGTAGTSALMAPLTRLLLEHGADPNARDQRGIAVHKSARAPDVRAVLGEFQAAKRPR